MSEESPLLLQFEPRTIEHLGVRMYSTLPPALAELISNAYDADAENVSIELTQKDGVPLSIKVSDDGCGMSSDDIKEKFLVIGRNRRQDEGDVPSPKFDRYATGKKGLGKLALFGLAKTISVETKKDGQVNEFTLSWDALMDSSGQYQPEWSVRDDATEESDGTVITLKDLKRKSPFDINALSESLSLIFYFDDSFHLTLKDDAGNVVAVNNTQKYTTINGEFSWDEGDWLPKECEYPKLTGKFISAETPISPRSGLRGITLFSRGKLVNAPEFFSESTSSHFYQYVTGYIIADFIDELDDDVISTNRQAVDWEHPEMAKFRKFLAATVKQINALWRAKRKAKKNDEVKDATGGIDRDEWMSKLPEDIKSSAESILNSLGDEDAIGKIAPVVKELYKIIPEYPRLHWRHLHPEIQDSAESDYKNEDYYRAFLEAAKRFSANTRVKSGSTQTSESSLMGESYGDNSTLSVTNGYTKPDGTNFTASTLKNIEEGQKLLSMGVITGGRNPVSHEEIRDLRDSRLFTEKDCLDGLSLLSHLQRRLDDA